MVEEILDISYKDINTGILSNLFPHSFSIDGVNCKSMEGFLQSLKFKDEEIRKIVQEYWGIDAYKAGRATDWRKAQVLYWKGQIIGRHSQEYQELLDRAYGINGNEGLIKNALFRKAIINSKGKKITHTGVDNPSETVLTTEEYISRLEKIRELLLAKEKDFERE